MALSSIEPLPESAPRSPGPSHVSGPAGDPHRRHWGAVTVRIVWDLVGGGIRPRAQVVREIREHALLHLGAHADTVEAEDTASCAVADWLRRREGNYLAFPVAELADILPDPDWRRAILDGCEPLHEAVFRLRYADGVGIDEVVNRVGVDAAWVRASLEALRSVGRTVVAEDGVSTEGWTDQQVDALLSRIANTAGNACPGPEGLLTELGRTHAEQCPRCSRAHRLISGGFLAPGALFAPDDGPVLVHQSIELLCLQLHPGAMSFARLVLRQLDEHVRVLDGGLMLVNVAAVPDLEERLAALTERGMPALAQVRGVRRRVRAQWGRQAVLGPGPLQLAEAVQHTSWGEVEGVTLPEPLPPPPSSLRWYGSLLLAALLAVAVGLYAWTHRAPPATFALTASRTPSGVVFDTADAAFVDVFAIDGRSGTALFHSAAPSDKGAIATGDGRYQAASDSEILVVVTAPQPIENVVGLAALADDPTRFADAVREGNPGAAVAVLERSVAVQVGPFTLTPGELPWR